MKKILKYPIFSFAVLAFILVVCFSLIAIFYLQTLGFLFGIFWVVGFCLSFSPLIIISLLFLNFKMPYRRIFEVALIVVYFLILYVTLEKPEPANEIYLYNQNVPLSEYDQNFIIVFGIEGQPELDDNIYFTNRINIPEDGIYLTSSTWSDDWVGRKNIWQVKGLNEWNEGAISLCDLHSCTSTSSNKFNFWAMTVNPSDGFDNEWFEFVADIICIKLNDQELKSTNLVKGCSGGIAY